MRHNVQVLLSDSGKRSGTGSALTVLKDSGVNTYRWQGGHQTTADIISEPDKGARYSRLAQEFAVSVREGQESVAQISGTREQSVLNGLIRDSLRQEGVLGEKDTTITALTPVWLDSKSRGVRDYYREGMVMERWDPETRTHDRFVIDRVTASSNMLTLKDREGDASGSEGFRGRQPVDAVPGRYTAGGRGGTSGGAREDTGHHALRRGRASQ
ncbi:conjugal transfer nickase/helicase TraI [Klebsiella pneumoniae]|nr:conjugal transfer nickase/helicase TraI [Klebsiella pneumoniae]